MIKLFTMCLVHWSILKKFFSSYVSKCADISCRKILSTWDYPQRWILGFWSSLLCALCVHGKQLHFYELNRCLLTFYIYIKFGLNRDIFFFDRVYAFPPVFWDSFSIPTFWKPEIWRAFFQRIWLSPICNSGFGLFILPHSTCRWISRIYSSGLHHRYAGFFALCFPAAYINRGTMYRG